MNTARICVKQRDITDCGAACIASVAMFYRLQVPVSRIRQYAGTDKKGTNVTGMIEAAEKLGFQVKAAKGSTDSLLKIPLPAIAHIILKNGLHHYIVIYQTTRKKISYMDPSDGLIHRISYSAFKEIWSGVLILLLPDENFKRGTHTISNACRFWHLIQPHSAIMIQALVGALLYTLLGLSTSIYIQKLIDFVLVEANLRLLNLLSFAMILILIFQLIIGSYKTIFGLQTGQMIDARLILGYYKHLLQLPQRFFDTMRVGEIISRINDAVKIRDFINSVALGIIVNMLIVFFSLLVMFLYYWKLALLMLVIIPIYLILYWINNRINRKWQRKLMEESAELETQLVESLNASGTIKRFGLEAFANEKTETRFFRLLNSIYKSSIYSLYIGISSEFFTRLFTIGLLWTGSYFVINRELSPGALLSFYTLIGYFTGPASALIAANKQIQDALIASDRLFEIIDLETESTEEASIHLTSEQTGDIVFNDIYFRYGSRSMIFQGLTLHIRKGECTAIVGESGSGKSTLLSLLQKLYPLKKGTIYIGDINIQQISYKSLRERIAIVPQHIDLFSGTITENIAIGDPEPDLKKILFLTQMLGIHSFIEQLPNSYNSIITEQGGNLSGGQKQRIAIARALYRDPEILLMDEATSNLDPHSEQDVQQTLEWYKQQEKTIIIIAHRLSTIRNSDHIIVLENGELAEQGTHATLLNNNGVYKKLWEYYAGDKK
ncbi:peptidase domain-containing ABC transporter [Sediminibacterium goheungense]|uniref:Bacteriocin-processing peptidase n=1 Tax=Sediminibacterium goheungense TaxID=1086393 RepID=A0A4R6ISZ7_9BACT|nr:peptidase domain-containing ABC transporter [Sediminibacterium goheungense]TDO25427.1 bacteriocin-processing peptidase [Sediminibacterium goheungense]